MGLHLVTGYAGYQHVTASDQGAFNNALLLSGSYVLNIGNKFAASVNSNNSIKISDGELIMQGRHIRLKPGETEEVTIVNGTQDYKRNDLIVIRYTKNGTTGVENASFVVINGTPDITKATDPAYIEGNILNGVLTADLPLYRVRMNGLNIEKVEALFSTKDSFDKRIDNIQTTSRGTLSTAGWYRVAKYDGTDGSAPKCDVTFFNGYGVNYPEYVTIRVRMIHKTCEIKVIDAKSTVTTNLFTKARVVFDGTFSYIEVYYRPNNSNPVLAEINSSQSPYGAYAWAKLDFVATSETVSGVTVTTTYDIPANASPVTDLDLKQVTGKEIAKSILQTALDLSEGVYNYTSIGGGSYPASDLPSTNYAYSPATIIKRSANDIVVILWGRKSGSYTYPTAINIYGDTGWMGWETFATIADLTIALAGYLKNTGGEVRGYINQVYTDNSQIGRQLQNSVRHIHEYISPSGNYAKADVTNNKNIIVSMADGTNTFNGHSTEDVALNGSTTQVVNAPHVSPMAINSKVSDGVISLLGFQNNGTVLGYLGFNAVGSPVVRASGLGTLPLLHSGNYADYTIPKNGGGEVQKAGDIPFAVKNTTANSNTCLIGFTSGDGTNLALGLSGGKAVISGQGDILHTGNSAPVSINTVPPADYSYLWVNKLLKNVQAYIDGAWTVVS